MWKRESGSKGEIHLTGTEKRFVSWGFLFCARTSTLLPSFKLLRAGDFLLLLAWRLSQGYVWTNSLKNWQARKPPWLLWVVSLEQRWRDPRARDRRKLSHGCRQTRRKQSLSDIVSVSVSCGIKEVTYSLEKSRQAGKLRVDPLMAEN